MNPTNILKIENIDKIWITQAGDEILFLLKTKYDLTKLILTGDAIKNHNDNFITTLKVNLEENEKEFSKQDQKIRELREMNDDLEQEREAILEANDKLREEFDKVAEENKKLRNRINALKRPKTPKADNVNHPSHYETGKFECIEVMQEVFGITAVCDFCKCNAFKYIYRMDRKNGEEDARKAIWYLNKYLELMEKIDIYKEIGGLIPRPEFVKEERSSKEIELLSKYHNPCNHCVHADVINYDEPCSSCYRFNKFKESNGGTDNGGKTQVPEGE